MVDTFFDQDFMEDQLDSKMLKDRPLGQAKKARKGPITEDEFEQI